MKRYISCKKLYRVILKTFICIVFICKVLNDMVCKNYQIKYYLMSFQFSKCLKVMVVSVLYDELPFTFELCFIHH